MTRTSRFRPRNKRGWFALAGAVVAGAIGIPVIVLVVAAAISVLGFGGGKHTVYEETSEDRAFARGICPFLASQPEIDLRPPGSTLVARNFENDCKHIDSMGPPGYGVTVDYLWSGDPRAWRTTFAYYRRALVQRGWGEFAEAGYKNPGTDFHRLTAFTTREGKRIRLSVNWDAGTEDVWRRTPEERLEFWVGISTSRYLQDPARTGTGPGRATLPR